MKFNFEHHRIKIFILLSLFIHILFISSNYLKNKLFLTRTSITENNLIELITIPKDKYEIVDRQLEANNEIPVKSSFLSNKNNQVDKETKAKLSQTFKKSIISKNNDNVKQKNKLDNSNAIDTFNEPKLAKLKEALYDFSDLKENIYIPENSDYLPETLESEKTALNTREFLYFSYYERIKQRIGMFWTPALEEKFKRLAFANIRLENSDLITKLIIVLDNNGYVKEIEKVASSGYIELDDAAVEAFNKAAPFANPPTGILDENKNVILKWDFILTS